MLLASVSSHLRLFSFVNRLYLPILFSSNRIKRRALGAMSVAAGPSCSSPSLSSLESELDPYLEHVKRCNRGSEERAAFIPFVVDDVTVGYIHPSFLQHLIPFSKVFSVGRRKETLKPNDLTNAYVTLHPELKSLEDRTKCVNSCLKMLSEGGIIPGWRDEMYPVVNTFGAAPLFLLERSAVPYFGTKAYGVHINGFSIDSNGVKYLWVARRSMTKQTFPGMLDHIVAGGQPVGLSWWENVIKECDEEAGIPRELAARALPVSAVSYEDIEFSRFKRDVLFCYDLELPMDFKPENQDGEVDNFNLLPVAKVEELLKESTAYKPNCAVVVIDFLIRHGYISPDQKGYLQLFSSLRQGECY